MKKSYFSKGATFVVPFFIFGCTSQTALVDRSTSTAAKTSDFAISFTYDRHLEMEPCGCEVAPIGGMDREYNALQQWREKSPLLVLSGGSTFYPDPSHHKKFTLEMNAKTEAMVDALNALGTSAIAPSQWDLKLGLAKLKKLQDRARFSFLSANLFKKGTGRSAFEPFKVFEQSSRKIVVVGLTGKMSDTAEVQWRDPSTSLRALLPVMPASRFLVVISSLTKKQQNVLLRNVPEINVLLGASDYEKGFAEGMAAKTVFISPLGLGRAVSRLAFSGPINSTRFFDEQEADRAIRSLLRDSTQLEMVDWEMAQTKSKSEKAKLAIQKRVLQKSVALNEPLAADMTPTSLRVDSDYAILTAEYAVPKNPVSEILAKYHETVRQISMAELDQ